MADSLVKYIDETYSCSEDSVHTGVMVRCTSGSALYTRSFWPEKRYFKYTAFVEPDSVYHSKGINTIDDLKAYAKKIYDQTYPEDAGLYDLLAVDGFPVVRHGDHRVAVLLPFFP